LRDESDTGSIRSAADKKSMTSQKVQQINNNLAEEKA